jgi:hypothetical protein
LTTLRLLPTIRGEARGSGAKLTSGFGISHGGDNAEAMFIALTGAERSPTAALGDAVLDGFPIEIKQATKNTLNQVRAVKYIPLVVLYVPDEQWYVVPAHVVVAAVSQKRRGQHTENPFESATLNVNALGAYKVEARQLRDRTLAAVRDSAQYPELRDLMTDVLRESKELAGDTLDRARRLLHELGLGT